MITQKESDIIKEFIGPKHLVKLEAYVRNKGLKSKFKKPFSSRFIGLVIDGKRPHDEVEAEIWNFIEELKEKRLRQNQRKDRLIKDIQNHNN